MNSIPQGAYLITFEFFSRRQIYLDILYLLLVKEYTFSRKYSYVEIYPKPISKQDKSRNMHDICHTIGLTFGNAWPSSWISLLCQAAILSHQPLDLSACEEAFISVAKFGKSRKSACPTVLSTSPTLSAHCFPSFYSISIINY